MNKVTVIAKASCLASKSLLSYLEGLSSDCLNLIGVLDEQTSSTKDLYNILDSYGVYGFPTIVLHGKKSYDGEDTIISGFTEHTKPIILNHLAC
jgi:thioredoxin-related protein